MRKVGCKELRYKVIYRFRDRFTVEELCKLLEVSRSGYYKWLKRKDKPDRDKIVADLIAECHEKAHRTYGYRRVKIWLLRETGLVINHKAVLRIMRTYNLLAIRKRKRFRHYGNVKKCAVGKYPKSEKLGSAGQAACCACAHSRYLTGGSPSGLRV